MYKIGEFSKLCKVSVNTLRFYDSEGLLKADIIDQYTGYRYYSAANLKQMHLLISLKEAGFSLDEIKNLLKNKIEPDTVIENKQNELNESMENIRQSLIRLNNLKKSLQKEGKNMLNVIVKENNPVKVASIRKFISGRQGIDETVRQIKNYLAKNTIIPGEMVVAINYEIEFVETDMDFEIGVSFNGKLPDNSPYSEKLIDINEKAASVICNVDEIEKAYESLHLFSGEHLYQIIGPFYELKHDNNTIEIFVPVCKLSEASDKPNNDDIDLPFEDDPQAIGHWELVDCLPSKEQFYIDKIKYHGPKEIKDIYCLPGGEQYWCFSWTKGFIFTKFGHPNEKGKNRYTIEEIKGQKYMFVEMKLKEYFFQNGRPENWVFKQLDNKEYKISEIRKTEDTNLPFVTDENVIGKWVSYDCIKEIVKFDPDTHRFPQDSLYWKTVEFVDDGNCKISFEYNPNNSKSDYEQPDFTWTKGFVLAHISKVAEAYEIHRIKGCDYLFVEWKSGDYTLAGKKPVYYVFRRA
ncbi:MAG: MerR family transcriptional regulator [Saccharofermentanales bacterium]